MLAVCLLCFCCEFVNWFTLCLVLAFLEMLYHVTLMKETDAFKNNSVVSVCLIKNLCQKYLYRFLLNMKRSESYRPSHWLFTSALSTTAVIAIRTMVSMPALLLCGFGQQWVTNEMTFASFQIFLGQVLNFKENYGIMESNVH